MDIILVVLLVLLVGIASSILYLNLKSKPKDDKENKEAEEIANLKTEIQNLKDTLNNIKVSSNCIKCNYCPYNKYNFQY